MAITNKTLDRIETLRLNTISLLAELMEKTKKFELPEPPEAMEMHRQKLQENTYKVLVVGEAKRGKSTFVNALIGKPILPTDVDIATCQVFHISQSENEAYRIRFEDDSQQTIKSEDLPKYGSQVIQDSEGVPTLDQIIRWIEIEAPISFLPKGVSILDTPGLGSLYAAHEQVTSRFIPMADAVIFVLDSKQPIDRQELEFLTDILEVTKNVFFIQTKIDQHQTDAWQEIQRRNEQIIKEKFSDKLNDVRIWPISSTNLLVAGETQDEDFLEVSLYQELAAGLQAFLFRVAGWSRAAEALLLADHFHSQSRNILSNRNALLIEESQQKRTEAQNQLRQRKREFEEGWGGLGKKRKELIASLQKVAKLGKESFRQELQMDSDIFAKHRQKIQAIQLLEEANQVGEKMNGEVAADISKKWRQTCNQAQNKCIELIGPFVEAAEELNLVKDKTGSKVKVNTSISLDLKDELWGKIKSARMESFQAAGAAAIAGYAISIVGTMAGFVLMPYVVVGAALAGIWGIGRGWNRGKERQIKNAQNELQRHLNEILTQMRRHFLKVDGSLGRASVLDEFFENLIKKVNDHLDKVASQKSQELAADLKRLSEESKLNDQERKAKSQEALHRMKEWDTSAQLIKKLGTDLAEMDKSFSAPQTAAAQ